MTASQSALSYKPQRHPFLTLMAGMGCLLLIAACTPTNKAFRLEGHFKGMNQAELYLYDENSGQLDTIQLRQGQFRLARQVADTTVLCLMFPNFSELPIVSEPNAKVKIEGDASQLRKTTVKGTPLNKELNDFRLDANSKTPQAAKQSAKAYIIAHPTSPLCGYILRHYFLAPGKTDHTTAAALCDTMLKSNPQNMPLKRLSQRLKRLAATEKGKKLPTFSAKAIDGRTATSTSLKAEANIVYTWAQWNFDSVVLQSNINRLKKKYRQQLEVVGICLMPDTNECKQTIERDSIAWPMICDGKMILTPLARKLELTSMPANIITDKNGIIKARNVKQQDLEKEIEKLIDNKK